MQISKVDFFAACLQEGLPERQIDSIWQKLVLLENDKKSSPFANLLYYLGAMLIISAMTWFMNLGWELFGGGGVFLISSSYAIIFLILGNYLWNFPAYRTPAGLLVTIAACMVPLAIYGLETHFQLFDEQHHYNAFFYEIDGRYVLMEAGTILAALFALRFFPFPFLTAPLFFSAWFLSMDLSPLLFKRDTFPDLDYWIALIFGLGMICVGILLDKKNAKDYAFWSYLFGALAFWGGLSCLVYDKGEAVLFVYAVINLFMMAFSLIAKRYVFMVFGAIGLFGYLAHLTQNLFQNSVLFPFVLSFIGLTVIYFGIVFQRNRIKIERKLLDYLPSFIRTLFSTTDKT
jgi:hypothetical protein